MSASRVLVAVAARSIQPFEGQVTLPQFRVLVVLCARGPTTIGRLADELGVVPSTATRIGERLIAAALASRSAGENDRRSVLLTASEAGRGIVEAVSSRRRQEIQDILARMIPEQQRGLVQALHAFAEAAGEVPEWEWSMPATGPSAALPA